ncbi:hypothetical protein [Chitinophaga japonensis]|uniref:Uncharacterized protein n=1 Tax=Chitinophaga japonensis TaxID=104662 RepID=A0A562TE98_CHIJA|nr:hypothetical protein [Chitinophaga japonensis]TWI91416.1 hypothetical protein LX66_0785 [Chitinophaga japonensis]
MKRFLLALAVIFSQLSCNTAPSGANTAVLKITEPGAVFYTPNEYKLRQLQKEFGEKSYPGIAALNQQYMDSARQFLASRNVKIINTSQFRLEFVKKDGTVIPLDLNHSKYAWEIFLFNGIDDPVQVDKTNIREEYRAARMGKISNE